MPHSRASSIALLAAGAGLILGGCALPTPASVPGAVPSSLGGDVLEETRRVDVVVQCEGCAVTIIAGSDSHAEPHVEGTFGHAFNSRAGSNSTVTVQVEPGEGRYVVLARITVDGRVAAEYGRADGATTGETVTLRTVLE